MTNQLDQQQLMDIAKDIVSKPAEKMPDYLTKKEEETVKELVKSLRASQMAMKTYVQKMVYNDALKKQIEIESNLAEALKWRMRSCSSAARQWSQLSNLTKNAQRNLKALNDSEREAVVSLNATISKQQERIMNLFIKNGIEPGMSFVRAVKWAKTNEWFSEFMNASGVGTEAWFGPMTNPKGELTRLWDKLRKTNPSLASTAELMTKKMDDASRELLTNYKLPSTDVYWTLKERVRNANMFVKHYTKEAKQLEGELAEQKALTERQQKLTAAMGGWYVVAAMAETLIELGQNLAC